MWLTQCQCFLLYIIKISVLFVFCKGKALISLHMKRTDSTSSLTEKEHIRSLDLSANDLENIDLINKKSLLNNYLERLEKLEVQQNILTSFPKSLCDVSGCLFE